MNTIAHPGIVEIPEATQISLPRKAKNLPPYLDVEAGAHLHPGGYNYKVVDPNGITVGIASTYQGAHDIKARRTPEYAVNEHLIIAPLADDEHQPIEKEY